ncbi:MAG: hypothetical protein IPO21_00830 [Bacteroidales bacterium]|nr:hypothetical protein [Bacteroidales bacterium]
MNTLYSTSRMPIAEVTKYGNFKAFFSRLQMPVVVPFFFMFLFGVNAAFSQSAITITSNNENVRFCVFFDEQQMHNFFETRVDINNVPAGYKYVRIVFESDSVSDVYKNIMFTAAQRKTFLVKEKPEARRELSEKSRNLGEKNNIGEHDSTYNYLVDLFYIEQEKKEAFSAESQELEVSTDNSLSTSILPMNKKKK